MSLFQDFVRDINRIVKQQRREDSRSQEELLNALFDCEQRFRDMLVSTSKGEKTYADFIVYIREVKRNILSSRIFFRERQGTFTQEMSICFKEPDPRKLQQYRINYEFVKWVLKNYKGPKKKKLTAIKDEMVKLRTMLMYKDVFLALSRAKIFSTRAPNWRIEHMDMVQDACEGYLIAVDKFVPPYTNVFRSVAIGRMTLLMLTDRNATMVKFSPTESRILYRARNAKYKVGLQDPKDILEYVRESYPKTTLEQLARIEAATGVSSLDGSLESSQDTGHPIHYVNNLSDETVDIMQEASLNQATEKMAVAFNCLNLLEQKALRLKYGITKDDNLCKILSKK